MDFKMLSDLDIYAERLDGMATIMLDDGNHVTASRLEAISKSLREMSKRELEIVNMANEATSIFASETSS